MSTAFVSILLSNDYLPGLITLALSLQNVNSVHKRIVLLSNELTNLNELIEVLTLEDNGSCLFHQCIVIPTDQLLVSNHLENLKAFDNRLELLYTMTKIQLFGNLLCDLKLSKCCYLDSDLLILQNIDELLDSRACSYAIDQNEYLSKMGYTSESFELDNGLQVMAVPERNWPDFFNSGLFVFKPDMNIYYQLLDYYKSGFYLNDTHSSFDGADQGLLNEFFTLNHQPPASNISGSEEMAGISSSSSRKTWKKLPFIYNVTSSELITAQTPIEPKTTSYEFRPIFNKFHKFIKVFHFIGSKHETKPWFNKGAKLNLALPKIYYFDKLSNFYEIWWDLFNSKYFGYNESLVLKLSGLIQDSSITIPKSKLISEDEPITQVSEIPTADLPKEEEEKHSEDLSKFGEAWRLNDSKLVNTWDEQKHSPEPEPVSTHESQDFDSGNESESDEYVKSHPIFPWELTKNRPKASRTFRNNHFSNALFDNILSQSIVPEEESEGDEDEQEGQEASQDAENEVTARDVLAEDKRDIKEDKFIDSVINKLEKL